MWLFGNTAERVRTLQFCGRHFYRPGGGARLSRRYRLYDLTEERDLGRYWEEYDQSWD